MVKLCFNHALCCITFQIVFEIFESCCNRVLLLLQVLADMKSAMVNRQVGPSTNSFLLDDNAQQAAHFLSEDPQSDDKVWALALRTFISDNSRWPNVVNLKEPVK